MALIDQVSLGMSLPHRSLQPLEPAEIAHVAQRAEALGFADLWVTENTLDHVYSLDPTVILTYAGAMTRTIRLGVSVVVLPVRHPVHVAHAVASLDYLTGGRAILGVGLGREQHYQEFDTPSERRVRRLRESVELMRALWSQPEVDYAGQIYHLSGAGIPLKPVQQPGPPVWMGGTHPDAVRRAATLADGWMGAGGQTTQSFRESVPVLREALEAAGRDAATFPISKRVFLAVDEKPEVARERLAAWFGGVYRNAEQTDRAGIHGTPSQVREQLEALADTGCSHLLLNPVSHYSEQVEALAEVAGIRG